MTGHLEELKTKSLSLSADAAGSARGILLCKKSIDLWAANQE
jgi:hypothetical protein